MEAALGRIIECPVCLEVPKCIPIYRCDNGHIFCKECKKKLTRCPQCRIRLEGKRCLISEKIVREFLLKASDENSLPSSPEPEPDPDPYYSSRNREGNNDTNLVSNSSNNLWWGIGLGVAATTGIYLATSLFSSAKSTEEAKNDKDKNEQKRKEK